MRSRVLRLKGFWRAALVALRHVGSSPARDQTLVPCTGRRVLVRWDTRAAGACLFFMEGGGWWDVKNQTLLSFWRSYQYAPREGGQSGSWIRTACLWRMLLTTLLPASSKDSPQWWCGEGWRRAAGTVNWPAVYSWDGQAFSQGVITWRGESDKLCHYFQLWWLVSPVFQVPQKIVLAVQREKSFQTTAHELPMGSRHCAGLQGSEDEEERALCVRIS